MPIVRISARADADIDSIAKYSAETWGHVQADIYLTELQAGFDFLAHNPLMGRACDSIQPGLRRYEVEKHVVFYRIVTGGIRIVRVLHQRMLPASSRFEA